jgi:hypothetical protein
MIPGQVIIRYMDLNGKDYEVIMLADPGLLRVWPYHHHATSEILQAADLLAQHLRQNPLVEQDYFGA